MPQLLDVPHQARWQKPIDTSVGVIVVGLHGFPVPSQRLLSRPKAQPAEHVVHKGAERRLVTAARRHFKPRDPVPLQGQMHDQVIFRIRPWTTTARRRRRPFHAARRRLRRTLYRGGPADLTKNAGLQPGS